MGDQTILKIGLVKPVGEGETKAKVQSLFTKGAGKKRSRENVSGVMRE